MAFHSSPSSIDYLHHEDKELSHLLEYPKRLVANLLEGV